jgi:hypothetical protein
MVTTTCSWPTMDSTYPTTRGWFEAQNIEGPYLRHHRAQLYQRKRRQLPHCYPSLQIQFEQRMGRHSTLLYLPKGKYQRMVLHVARTIACQRWGHRLFQCHYDGARTPHCLVPGLAQANPTTCGQLPCPSVTPAFLIMAPSPKTRLWEMGAHQP